MFKIPVLAQETEAPGFILKHYTNDNGLPQNSIKSILKGENGFIWLTTEDGIVRFDGQSFKNFNKKNLATSSNRFGHFFSVFGDDNYYVNNAENEYFFIENGKVFVTDKRREKLKSVRFERDSTYWIEGLWDTDRRYLDLNIKYTNIKISVKPQEYFQFFHDKVVFSGSTGKTHFPASVPDFWGLFSMDKQIYYHDKSGAFLHISNKKTTPVTLSGDILAHPAWIGDKTPYEILWNKNSGSTVCIKLENSLYLARRSSETTIETTLLLKSFDFYNNQIANILYDDPSKTLWLGSKNNGLFLFAPKQFKSVTSDLHRYTNEIYYAQAPVSDSSVYTPQGHILGMQIRAAAILPFKKESPNKYALLTDKEGYIWMESENQLFRVDQHFNIHGKWQVFDEVTTLLEGTDNWVYAGRREKGLFRINKSQAGGDFEFITNRIKDISYLAQESADILLIGAAKGLFKYNLKTKRIAAIAGLENKFIRSIYCPKPYDKIWVTTYGDGFYLVTNGQLTAFPLDKDSYLATAHCMIEDSRGYFWITTNKGLFQASKKDLIAYAANNLYHVYYAYYSRENGFNSNEFNGGCQPCAVHLKNGSISLPSMNGLVFFKPEEIISNLNNTKIFIDDVVVDNTPVPLKKITTLQHGFSLLQIAVSTPFLENRSNVQLQYALNQESKQGMWFPVAENGLISISNLSSGSYVLTVRKASGFGGAYIQTSLQLRVLAAWYETWLARLIAALLVILLGFLFNKWRTRNLMRRNQILENQIDAKTQVLKITLENLQTSQENLLRQVFLYERLVAAVSHDIKTPLLFLNRSSEYLHRQHEAENVSASLLKIGKSNWDFSSRLLNLTNNLLEFIKSWLAKDKTDPEAVNLHDLVQEKISIFLVIAQEKNTVIQNNINPDLKIESYHGMLSVIFYNLIDNALKATKDGSIVISDSVLGGRLHISVTDSGLGMDQEIAYWVNHYSEGSQKVYAHSNRPVHDGIGLMLTIELAALIGLKISAESGETSGTKMLVIFPDTYPAITPSGPTFSLT